MEDIFESLKTFECEVDPIPWGGGGSGEFNSFYGKTHTEESKLLMSESRKGECLGNKNGFTKENTSGEFNSCYNKFGKDHPAYGHKKSNEFKKNASKRISGQSNPMFGRTGELSPVSKFTSKELQEISEKYKSGMTRNEIYFYYNKRYSLSTIKRAIRKYV